MDPNLSSESESKQPIEPSMESADSADPGTHLGKRKGVDSDGSDVDSESEKGSTQSDQVWGYDSFEGSEYESPEEEPQNKDIFEFRRYLRHIHETKGFRVDKELVPEDLFQGPRNYNLDAPFDPPNDVRHYMEIAAKIAVEKYKKKEHKYLEFHSIVRAVVRMATGVKAYITFMARESPDGELVEYQAKTDSMVWQKTIHPILCRRAPN